MKRLLILLAAIFAIPSTAFASQCDQFFPNGKEIVIPDTMVLCNTFYVSVWDPIHEAVIFSSEVPTVNAGKAKRTNDFHADKRLGAVSPTPEDYTNTGYDRGHMAPAADAGDQTQMSDTFLMTNMTPQLPNVNRVIWKNLEERVRSVPFKTVLTGAIYSYPAKQIGKHGVTVPVALFKVVYYNDGKTNVYFVENVQGAVLKTMTIEELEAKTGYKLK